MKCLILAAGYATRLYPLTENFPKPLLKVQEKTILDHLIDDIERSANISEYVVISNHKYASTFEAWAKDKPYKIKVVDDGTSTNETRLGAVRDIQFAIEKENIDDDLLVIAGDNLLDFSLGAFVSYAKRKGACCVMRYREPSEERLKKCGVLEIGNEDRILAMEEKPQEPKSHWCCPPFYIFTREAAGLIDKGIKSGCGVDAPGSFIAWLCQETEVYAMPMPGSRYDIGDLASYERVQKEYKGG